jgi:galactokinase
MQQNGKSLPSSIAAALPAIYGDDAALLRAQAERYGQALDRFRSLAGPGPATFVRAPGRVNLIGEHTDYNHGYVLPMALDKDTVLVVRRRSDAHVRLWNIEAERFAAREFDAGATIPAGPLGDWGNYVKAAAQAIYVHSQGALHGMDVLVAGADPLGAPRAAGLSSSSALLVVTALALCHTNEIALSGVALARLCSEAEWYVGTRGGIMDQFISVLAQRGHALLLDCRPQVNAQTGAAEYAQELVRIPDGYRVIICNSGVQRQKTRSQYNVRVAECRLAVALLKHTYPHITHLRDVSAQGLALSEGQARSLIESLPERLEMSDVSADPALGEVLRALNTPFPADQVFMPRARARHVVTENQRVGDGVAALRRGDAPAFGRLMNAAHASMSRDYDASCSEVDTLADLARRAPGVLGARVTGAGWGGCVVAVQREGVAGFEEFVVAPYWRATGLSADVFVCRSGPGASVVGEVA